MPNSTAFLNALYPITEPDFIPTVSFIPTGLAVFALCIVAFLYFQWCRKKRAYRMKAIRQIHALKPNNSTEFIRSINHILKQVALSAYHPKVATLYGKNWIDFLNYSANRTIFIGKIAHVMIQHHYTHDHDLIINQTYIARLAIRWIHHHKPIKLPLLFAWLEQR